MTKTIQGGRRQAPVRNASPCASPAPAAGAAARANRWRDALRWLLTKHRLLPADLARRIGAPNPNLIYNFLSGRSHSLSQETLERICAALPGTEMCDLFGPARLRPATCLIVAEAVAGAVQDSFMLPPALQHLMSLPGAWGHSPELFGVRVGLPGAGRLYRAGSLLLCRPYDGGGGSDLAAGCRVIVQQPLGAGVEVTVRELALRPAPGRPAADPDALRWPAHPSICLAGIVIASWQPEPAPHAS